MHPYTCPYRRVPGKCLLPGKRPCNCFGCLNGKRPGNVSQDCSDDKAEENTYEDNGDADNLDPSSDSDK